ncbi:MerR family transcriptional regulator [uncultured Imperialibacter sp.]|uniref:MerR family transcriptional regulator n=1 Tax=uncultured Imperialibacter sp. TaxID=1672639 RepID=UPI0030D98EE4|tara:strand:- start:238790 stop:239557 length:768 start_codon:yes stop_codon:yes gene_type:complete
MAGYTVKKLAKLAGVSVRTLHHYDQIGLLTPEERGFDSGYRYYGRHEMLRLQQILFYRELGFALKEIKKIMDEKDFDLLESLEFQKSEIHKQIARNKVLLGTLEKTIDEIKNRKKMVTDKEMYEGFTEEQVTTYRQEVVDRWGKEALDHSENVIRNKTKEEWAHTKKQSDDFCRQMVPLMSQPVTHREVQQLIAKHHAWIGQFFEVTEEKYRGLADMYVADERFKVNYEKFAVGLAEYMKKAMCQFCENGMKVQK